MTSDRIVQADIPSNTLIAACWPDDEATRHETHLDCFTTTVEGKVSLEDFLGAFYSTGLFKTERFILRFLAGRASSQQDLDALLDGHGDRFAVWTQEARTEDQILMCDMTPKTKSWFMVRPEEESLQNDATQARTKIYFGTVVIATPDRHTGKASLGRGFRVFLSLHLLYSRALLSAAARSLKS